MKGYTIQHSIDLLEKQVEAGGSGGSTTAENVSYDNTSSGLTADDGQEAIDELKTDLGTVAASVPTIAQYGANYSTTEHVVGSWIDGTTPVYEKTLDTGALPANTSKKVPHGISDLAYVISMIGVALQPGTSDFFVPLPFVHYSALANCIELSVDGDDVQIRDANSGYSAFTQSYVTLRYIKTAPVSNTRSKKK